MLNQIKQKIISALPEADVQLIDHSQDHVEHGNTGSHLEVQVTYQGFEGKSLIEQHQMIYNILKEEMKEQIHALKIRTKVK